jgi:hypothetical protein
MLATQRSLAQTQLSRNSLKEITEAKAPWRAAALESFRRRNAVLDALFYDVKMVSSAEAQSIGPTLAREGAVLIVPPSGEGPLTLCNGLEEFVARSEGRVRAMAVAGVGSSALGSAAFARNVADAIREPVAAVVSGYGLADLASEALGGWFWFGTLNGVRSQFEGLDKATANPSRISIEASIDDAASFVDRLSLDTKMVCGLLADKRLDFKLLTGHSKGNLVISEALYSIATGRTKVAKFVPNDLWIVKVSAAVALPESFANSVDVMGDFDWLGAMNSRFPLGIELKWNSAWHHTNTDLPFHLPVTKAFNQLLRTRPNPFRPPH